MAHLLDDTAVAICLMVAFWAAVIWLFASRAGNTILRVVGIIFLTACLVGGLYLHWEPYVAGFCLAGGFAAGVLFAEWHYGVHRVTAPRSDQERQRPPSDRMAHSQPEPHPMLDYGRDGQARLTDPARSQHG